MGRPSGRLVVAVLAGLSIFTIYIYHLGSLTGGASLTELQSVKNGLGTTGILHNPLYLPLQLLRSIVFVAFGTQSLFLDRLPNLIFGLLVVGIFAYLISLWHDAKTTIFASIIFALSPWVLHVSRLASFDVMYLLVVPALLLSHVLLHRYIKKPYVFVGALFTWSILLYIPGAVWLVLWNIYLQRSDIKSAWSNSLNLFQKTVAIFASLVWAPLVATMIIGHTRIVEYLGLPNSYAAPLQELKHAASIPYHLFLVGPEYPSIWLGHSPILNIFCLVMCLLGIYYYVDHWSASRSRLLISLFLISIFIVAANGVVGLTLLIPFLYIFIAMGIAFLLKQWLTVFPLNPLARGLGIGILVFAVTLSSVYGLRSYFVAWPANSVTKSIFRYHP